MTQTYTRNDHFWIAGSSVVTLAFGLVFADALPSLRGAWPFWSSLLCTGVFVLIPPLRRRRSPRRDRVAVDGEGIERLAAGGTRESIRWDCIDRVFIASSGEGTGPDELFWVYVDETAGGGCAVPASAEGFEALLERTRALEGFDHHAAAGAPDSLRGRERIDVWLRAGAKTVVPASTLAGPGPE